MAEYRREVGAAVVVAVLLAAALGAVVIYSFGAGPTPSSSSTGPADLGQVTDINTSQSYSTTVENVTMTTGSTVTLPPTETFSGPVPDAGSVVAAFLGSPTVQSYIVTAYSWSLSYKTPSNDQDLAMLGLNITGAQSVSGNWTTGYSVSYTGNVFISGNVTYVPADNYTLGPLSVHELPDSGYRETFDPQQEAILSVVFSNSTVRGLMAGSAFYAKAPVQIPPGNGTLGGDYFTYLMQVDGPRTIGVYVNSGASAVLLASPGSDYTTLCFGSVPDCFTSPWNSTQ